LGEYHLLIRIFVQFNFEVLKATAPHATASSPADFVFLKTISDEMVRIVRQEIKREVFGQPSKEVKKLLKSWRSEVVATTIRLWSDHPAMTGQEEEPPEEEEPEPVPTVDEEGEPLPTRVIIRNNRVRVQEIKVKQLADGTWLFPPYRRTEFMARAATRILALIHREVSQRFSVGKVRL
jgi:hypothetical protein